MRGLTKKVNKSKKRKKSNYDENFVIYLRIDGYSDSLQETFRSKTVDIKVKGLDKIR